MWLVGWLVAGRNGTKRRLICGMVAGFDSVMLASIWSMLKHIISNQASKDLKTVAAPKTLHFRLKRVEGGNCVSVCVFGLILHRCGLRGSYFHHRALTHKYQCNAD